MKTYRQKIRDAAVMVFTAALIAGTVVACNGSSDAGTSGVSQAAFNALVKRVEALEADKKAQAKQIAALQNTGATLTQAIETNADALASVARLKRSYLWIGTPNATLPDTASPRSTLSLESTATATTETMPCIGLGNISGWVDNSNPLASSTLAGTQCTGYQYLVKAATASQTAKILPLVGATFYFTGANCTGSIYVSGPAATASVNGYVFTADFDADEMAGDDWADAANYYYVAAGSPLSQVAAQSLFSTGEDNGGGGCQPWLVVGHQPFGWAVLPNDPAVTGIQSAPYPGPVMPTNGG